jgi:hypothetical protein
MTLEDLKDRAFKMRPDLPMRAVIDRLARLWAGPGTAFAPEDLQLPLQEVYTAFILLSHEPLHILRSRWVFSDGEEYTVDYATLEKALATGSFQHPKTGAPVEHWMGSVGIIYESGPALDAAMVTTVG